MASAVAHIRGVKSMMRAFDTITIVRHALWVEARVLAGWRSGGWSGHGEPGTPGRSPGGEHVFQGRTYVGCHKVQVRGTPSGTGILPVMLKQMPQGASLL